MSAGNAQPMSLSPQSAPSQHITIYLNPAVTPSVEHSRHNQQQPPAVDHHQLMPPKISTDSNDTYQISTMQPVSSGDLQQSCIHQPPFSTSIIQTTPASSTTSITTTATTNVVVSPASISTNANATPNQNTNDIQAEKSQAQEQRASSDQNSPSTTRFKWTEEKSQVAMNLVKYGCKPKLISVAVGCSLRTAQKFAETVTPKMEGESFKTYQIKRRGRKSKDVNQRLNAIREVLSKNSSLTQVEIAADLKVSNTTVCRDLKRLGASWKEKKNGTMSSGNSNLESNTSDEQNTKKSETSSPQQTTTSRKTRQTNSKNQNNNNTNDDNTKSATKSKRQPRRNNKTNNANNNTNSTPGEGQNHTANKSEKVELN